jgi:anaerobic magnesium-protoporphyrin IX monomethyl ester cyclase
VKIVLIQPSSFFSWEALNLGYIAAYIQRSGFEDIDFFTAAFDSEHDILESCKNADVVGFTCTSPQLKHARYLARNIKKEKPSILTVFGGVHPSALPSATAAFPEVDIVVVGEGEEAMLKILNGNRNPIIHGSPINNIDTLPFPDRRLLKLERHLTKTQQAEGRRITSIFTSRGCPFKCPFCASHAVWGREQRRRSPEGIIEEFEILKTVWNVDYISFADDEVGLNKKHFSELSELLVKKNNKIHWGCNVVVSTLNKDLLKLMWAAGCRDLWMGVESGSPKILEDMKKPFDISDIRKAFKIAKQLGFTRRAYVLLGMPNETLDDIALTDKLIEEIDPDIVGFTILAPFPGTEFYDAVKHKDVDWSQIDEYTNNLTSTKYLSNTDLHVVQKRMVQKYYAKRAYHHKLYE